MHSREIVKLYCKLIIPPLVLLGAMWLGSYLRTVPPTLEPIPPGYAPRSGHWPVVRAAHLKLEPACAVCGSTLDLQVHHILPFHENPERELDPDNLITVCGPGGHNCHLAWGHLFSYQSWNVDVRADAARMRAKIKSRPGGKD